MASPAAPVAEPEAPVQPVAPEAPAAPFAAMDELLPQEMLGPAARGHRARAERPAPQAAAPEATPSPEPPAAVPAPVAPSPAPEVTEPEVLTKEQHEAEVARRIQAYAARRDADALARAEAEATARIQQQRVDLAERARQGDLEAQARLAEDVAGQYEREKAERELLPTAWNQAVTTLKQQAEAAYAELPALKRPEALERVVAASATDTRTWLTAIATEVAADRDAFWQAEIEKLKAPDGPVAATIRSQLRETMPNPDTGEGAGGAGIVGNYDSEAKIRAAIAGGKITTTEARHYASQIGVSLTSRRR